MSDINTLRSAREQFPGKEIILPDKDELQIDIDSSEARIIFEHRLDELSSLIGKDELSSLIGKKEIWIHHEIASDSGYPNCHITLKCSDANFSPLERIALQFALGSDPIREKLSVYRFLLGSKEPTAFARTPKK